MKITNIFITGAIHSGKSTVINTMIENYSNIKIGGFRTIPIFEGNRKQGFLLQPFKGEEVCFAHIDMESNEQFDIYKFDPTIFENCGVKVLKYAVQNCDMIVMDEIGLMEKKAVKFKRMILNCLDSKKIVLGAFQKRAYWMQEMLQNRNDTKIFIIEQKNRVTIPNSILRIIENNRNF